MPNLCSSAYVIEGDAKEIKSTCLDVVFISHLYIINLENSFKVDFQEKSGQVNFGKIRFKP